MNRKQRRGLKKKGQKVLSPNDVQKLQAYHQMDQIYLLKKIFIAGCVINALLVVISVLIILKK